jgi:histidyl-tRNA synthetase
MPQEKILLQTPRGTYDVLPNEQHVWRYVESKLINNSENFGFNRIDTPSFEYSWIFKKSIGSGTDIIDKEMYALQSKENDLGLSLRPEGTAGIVRAYYEHGMHIQPTPLRLYYYGPMYRHDKPQKGRFRQFMQFGIESIGDSDPTEDALVISLGNQILSSIGIANNNYSLEINSIGCSDCSPKYTEKLKQYLYKKNKKLCADCMERSLTNPMRVFDCKNSKCIRSLKDAPTPLDNLCNDCKEHFKNVLEYLEETKVTFNVNFRLVRGLDYYTRTVFEFVSTSGETKGQAIIAGGRYDNLISKFGKRNAPAIGFGIGMERLISVVNSQKIKIEPEHKNIVFLVQLGNSAKKKALNLVRELTSINICALTAFSKDSLRSQLKAASRSGARYAIIIGQREILDNTVIIKDLKSGGQEIIDQANYLANITGKLQ